MISPINLMLVGWVFPKTVVEQVVREVNKLTVDCDVDYQMRCWWVCCGTIGWSTLARLRCHATLTVKYLPLVIATLCRWNASRIVATSSHWMSSTGDCYATVLTLSVCLFYASSCRWFWDCKICSFLLLLFLCRRSITLLSITPSKYISAVAFM